MTFIEDAVVKVIIVEDHELMRLSLGALLQFYPDIKVVGIAENGAAVLKLLPQLDADVILMDLKMPRMDGLTASQHIKNEFPKIKIIAYTSIEDPQVEVMAKTAPIDDFCYKNQEIDALVKLIRKYKK